MIKIPPAQGKLKVLRNQNFVGQSFTQWLTWVGGYSTLLPLEQDTCETCSTQSPWDAWWSWAPAAHSGNLLGSTPFIDCFCLSISLSFLLLVFCEVIFQINYLYIHPCLMTSFWVNINLDNVCCTPHGATLLAFSGTSGGSQHCHGWLLWTLSSPSCWWGANPEPHCSEKVLLATAQALCTSPSPSLHQVSGVGQLSVRYLGSGPITLLLFFGPWGSSGNRKKHSCCLPGMKTSCCFSLSWASPGNLFEMQILGPHPALPN